MSKSSLAKLCLLKLTIVTCILISDCRPTEESYDVKDSNFAQTYPPNSIVHDNLMREIGGGLDDTWVIYVEYDSTLAYNEKQKDNIEAAIKDDLNMWLQPLRDNGYSVVAKNKINIVRRKPSAKVDLTIKFTTNVGRSLWTAMHSNRTGTTMQITMRRSIGKSGNGLLPGTADFCRNSLRHELGHAFGLADTYIQKDQGRISTGGSPRTAGKHPESIMSCYYHGFKDRTRLASLTEDDKNGIINYYNIVHNSSPSQGCLSAELKFDHSPPAGCVPKQPLIYLAKYYADEDYHLVNNLSSDTSVNINDTDACGSSALHHAALGSKAQMLTTIIDNYKNTIDVNIHDSTGMTPLHLAVKRGYSTEAETIINELFEHPNTNINIVDNDGNTAYSYAKRHNEQVDLGKMAEHTRFPKEILTKLADGDSD